MKRYAVRVSDGRTVYVTASNSVLATQAVKNYGGKVILICTMGK